MGRKARKISKNGIYHVMMRGINRQTIFEDDEDRRRFLQTLLRYRSVCEYQMFAYCLMDNHVHLLIREAKIMEVSKVIGRISSSYVYWYNTKYDRVGHLFQERFKSEVVENARYFKTVLRYIHQNPLKAGLANDVFQCKWTSIHEYIQNAKIVDFEFGLSLFSPNNSQAINLYADYMQQQNEDECLELTEIIRIKDSELKEYMHQIGITSTSMLQQMEREKRNAILAELKQVEGASIRQISRVTGISKSVVQRAR